MSLGLSHSLSRSVSALCLQTTLTLLPRFKVKFSPDKVDTMVVQAIALLDDLDKEINIYSMRVKVMLLHRRSPVFLLNPGCRSGMAGISQRWQKS